MKFKMTTLVENTLGDNQLLKSEHGLSLYLETDGLRILFDTGQSDKFIKNAEQLNCNLNEVDYVIISHGHYDHSGGFVKLVEYMNPTFNLMLGNTFFRRKYKKLANGEYKFIGNTFDEAFLEENNILVRYISADVVYLTENVLIFSNFKSDNNIEKLNADLVIRENNDYMIDDFSDEIVLGIKTDKGLIIILGCSHVGVINILESIVEKTKMNIYGVIGGTHLVNADESRINKTIKFFKEMNIQWLGVSHCTGKNAEELMIKEFKEEFFYNNTGNVLRYEN